ncbi:hypothetical protein VBQ52_20770 [Klebsiella pneumoniae]|nr:hypothetical protein [Klebsiella pneumoniae]
MTIITVKDSLRAATEAASGGLQTIVYTSKGQPCFMNIVEKFSIEDVLPSLGMTGTHPAFIIDGKEVGQILVGTYGAVLKNGEFVSQPNLSPATFNIAPAFQTIYSQGAGFHPMTNVEFSALQALNFAASHVPYGNTDYGRSAKNYNYQGRVVSGGKPGDSVNSSFIYTGSGPVQYRHNLAYNGISDLVGNQFETVGGLRLMKDELQVYVNNDYAGLAANNVTWGTLSDKNWRAIDAVSGELIIPTYTGTTTKEYIPTTPRSVRVKGGMASSGSDDYTLYLPNWANLASMAKTTSTTAPVSDAAIDRLKLLGLYPLSTDITLVPGNASFGNPPDDERWFCRGGGFAGPANNSGATMNTFVTIWPNSAQPSYGARVCWFDTNELS